jgi:hypothetical protein
LCHSDVSAKQRAEGVCIARQCYCCGNDPPHARPTSRAQSHYRTSRDRHIRAIFWPGTNREGQADSYRSISQESFAACRLGGRAGTRNPLKQPRDAVTPDELLTSVSSRPEKRFPSVQFYTEFLWP